MKILINKANPQIRITAPEILENTYLDGKYGVPYCDFDNESCMMYLDKNLWTLVEEEPKHTEVWVEGRTIFEQEVGPTEGIRGKKEEIPSNVDLEKEIQAFLCNYDYEYDDDAPAYDIATHFYELGRKGGRK